MRVCRLLVLPSIAIGDDGADGDVDRAASAPAGRRALRAARRPAERRMRPPASWCALALAGVTTAAAATDGLSLLDLPVTGKVPVAAARYSAAVSRAPRGAGPVELALRVAGPFEGLNQLISQANEGSDAPLASRVTVIRDGLLDDSLRSERWDITLTRTSAGRWQVTQVNRSWRCRRGGQTEAFAGQPCP